MDYTDNCQSFPRFPFKPYSIQIDFMNALYESLNQGGVSMLESPTGTGKTLSIICSALQWLLDWRLKQESSIKSEQNQKNASDDEPDWMKNFTIKQNIEPPVKTTDNRASQKRFDITRAQYNHKLLVPCQHARGDTDKAESVDEFLLDEYESDGDDMDGTLSKRKATGGSLSSSGEEQGDDVVEEAGVKIYFCSRTHSQLSQFVKELRRTGFAKQIKVVCLGSRKNFCINEDVLKLGNPTRINERCIELQDDRRKKSSKTKVVNEARAVILAGGTLQPIEETRERLFPWLPPNDLRFFSCGHIIPPENILPIAVATGPSGRAFDFSFNSRSSTYMIEELGLLLCNMVMVVPEGIVVFFPSFEYMEEAHDTWKDTGILQRIIKKKRLFREPRKSSEVEHVLNRYTDTIRGPPISPMEAHEQMSGSVLLAVVGGKISEGINFSDGMGRCIVMVGLPYPNPFDIELMERVKYIENLGSSKRSGFSACEEYWSPGVNEGFGLLRRCTGRGKDYYENLCIKAVNQSIGRAIRHINDYAAILLVDFRYDSSRQAYANPTEKLPCWIKRCLVPSTISYGQVHQLLHAFFKHHKNKVMEHNQ